MTLIYFFIALGILVLVHEWGHYIVAKKSGVWVEKFSIGFGPKIIGFTKDGTDYRFAPIPLGGYVKLYGQDPLEDAEGDVEKAEEIAKDPRAFINKPLSKKLATVVAGPVMNFVLCLVVMPMVFMIGRLQPKVLNQAPVILDVAKNSPAEEVGFLKGDKILKIDGKEVQTWQDLMIQVNLAPEKNVVLTFVRDGKTQEKNMTVAIDKNRKEVVGYAGFEPLEFYANDPVVDTVQPGKPAELAGLKKGDRIIEINNQTITYWPELTESIQSADGKALNLKVNRDNQIVELTVKPEYDEDLQKYILGVSKQFNADLFEKKSLGFGAAIVKGTKENLKLFGLTFDVLKKLFTGDLAVKHLGGPIQIAKATSKAADSGLGEFIYLLAFLSMQLGILNLLPIPVLDGGHVVFMTIEWIRRKPISPKIRQTSTMIGMSCLLLLMFVVTINDINSVWGFQNILNSITGFFS